DAQNMAARTWQSFAGGATAGFFLGAGSLVLQGALTQATTPIPQTQPAAQRPEIAAQRPEIGTQGTGYTPTVQPPKPSMAMTEAEYAEYEATLPEPVEEEAAPAPQPAAAVPPEGQAAGVAKQPWEMTRDEYKKSYEGEVDITQDAETQALEQDIISKYPTEENKMRAGTGRFTDTKPVILYRGISQQELDDITSTGKVVGGKYSTPAEQALGAQWSATPEEATRAAFHDQKTKGVLGQQKYLIAVDASGKIFFGLETKRHTKDTPGRYPLKDISGGIGVSIPVEFDEVLLIERVGTPETGQRRATWGKIVDASPDIAYDALTNMYGTPTAGAAAQPTAQSTKSTPTIESTKATKSTEPAAQEAKDLPVPEEKDLARDARRQGGFLNVEALRDAIMKDYDELDTDIVASKKAATDAVANKAVAVLDKFFAERDVENQRIKIETALFQRRIAKAMGAKRFVPSANPKMADTSLAMMVYIDSLQYPGNVAYLEQLSDEQRRIYDLSRKLSPEIKAIADEIVAAERRSGELGMKEGVLLSALDNHIAHIWEFDTKGGIRQAKFRTKTPFAKQRTLVNGGILEGWAKGYTLKVQDVTVASQFSRTHINEAISGRHLIKLAKSEGMVATRNKAKANWIEIQHPNFSVWKYVGQVQMKESAAKGEIAVGDVVRPADRKNLGTVVSMSGDSATVRFANRDKGTEDTKTFDVADLKLALPSSPTSRVLPDGTVMEKVKLYAEPTMGEKLNRVFAPSAVRANMIGHWALKYNAILKQQILFTSLFHHQAFLRSAVLGGRDIDVKALMKLGREAMENFHPQLQELIAGGMTAGEIQDYDPRLIHDEQSIWGRVLAKTKPGDAIRKAVIKVRDANERYLFKVLGPHLKVGTGLIEYRYQLEKNKARIAAGEVTQEEIAAEVGRLQNNDFGGLHHERIYAKSKHRSESVQDMFQLLCLAPDWTESNVQSIIDTFRGGDRGAIHRAFWGRIMVKGIGATIALNLIMSAWDDETFWERYEKAWTAGNLKWLDVDVTPLAKAIGDGMTSLTGSDAFEMTPDSRKYFSLLGHFRDPLKFASHPIRSAKHKGSVAARIIGDAATGTDWAGRDFTTIGDLVGLNDKDDKGHLVKWKWGKGGALDTAQVPSYLLYEARSAMPIQVQNTLALVGGEMDFFDWWTKNLGMLTSTTRPQKKQRQRVPQ
ncbi:MAG TPA: hypothetical protein VMW24_06825, partial [Sedimentisphaerales bacterium]|nr:hypothetical protein [Sedimentisphaerales bacterium]